MVPEVCRRELLDHRRALVAWCVGIAAYVGLIAAIFPSIHGSVQFDRLVESYPDALKALFGLQGGSITTGAGYLDVELFSLMLPLLVLVLAIGAGARTFAGEEEAGRLELALSYPVRRSSVLLWKGAAVALEVVVACSRRGSRSSCSTRLPASTSRWGPRSRREPHCRAGLSLSECRPEWRRPVISWAACTRSQTGSTRSGTCLRSGSSARVRSAMERTLSVSSSSQRWRSAYSSSVPGE